MVACEASPSTPGFSCWRRCLRRVRIILSSYVFDFSKFELTLHCNCNCRRERVFLSTVIAKRYEANVLETEDGITIQLRGFINNSRTSQNGFASNVTNYSSLSQDSLLLNGFTENLFSLVVQLYKARVFISPKKKNCSKQQSTAYSWHQMVGFTL